MVRLIAKPRVTLMTARLAEIQLWQRNLASLVRSGLFSRAATQSHHGLHTVVGIYPDGTHSAVMAKYADLRRAEDAADLINRLAAELPRESN
jgi:hypothetical protein